MRRWRRRESWWPRRRADLRRALCQSFLLAVGLGALTSSALGARPDTEARVLIIAIPGLSWTEMRKAPMPNLHRLMSEGAVGLMPVADPRDRDVYRTWVTLGAGRAAVSARDATLVSPTPSGGVNTDLRRLREANARANTGARVGLLGDSLSCLGARTALVGDEGVQGEMAVCPGALMLCDGEGRVSRGVVSGSLRSGPTGRLDRVSVRRALSECLRDGGVVLLDLADAGQGGEDEERRAAAGLGARKAAALAETDEMIGDALFLLMGYRYLILVVCPVSPAHASPHVRTLGPVVMYPAQSRPTTALLISPSTRRPGLVAAADIAPTLLAWWQDAAGQGSTGRARAVSALDGATGRQMVGLALPDALARLDAIDRVLTDRYRLRVWVGRCLGVYGLLILVVGLGLALTGPGRASLVGTPALALAFAPIGLAVAGIVPAGHDVWHVGMAAVTAAGLGLLAARVGRSRAHGLAAAMLVGAAIIVVDVITGSWLIGRSTLEMGVMLGSRFYGIGNEYMGAAVGMTTIGLGALTQAWRGAGRLAVPAGAVVVLAIGAPGWGANWGGSFTACAGLVALWLLLARPVRPRHVVAAAGLLLASAALPAALDLAAPPEYRSHIGATAALVLSGQGGSLAGTVERKIGLSMGVLRGAPWAIPGALLIGVVFWLLLRKTGRGRQALGNSPGLAAGIGAALIAALVAMVSNDSGIAAAMGEVLAALGTVVYLGAREGQAVA